MASWVLLVLFVPMLILSSVHVHSSSPSWGDACSDCVQHHCHGHLGLQTASFHECVLCQFLTLPMLAVTAVALIVFHQVCIIRYALRQRVVHFDVCGIPSLRAPPVSLKY